MKEQNELGRTTSPKFPRWSGIEHRLSLVYTAESTANIFPPIVSSSSFTRALKLFGLYPRKVYRRRLRRRPGIFAPTHEEVISPNPPHARGLCQFEVIKIKALPRPSSRRGRPLSMGQIRHGRPGAGHSSAATYAGICMF